MTEFSVLLRHAADRRTPYFVDLHLCLKLVHAFLIVEFAYVLKPAVVDVCFLRKKNERKKLPVNACDCCSSFLKLLEQKGTLQRQVGFPVELLGFDSFHEINTKAHPKRVIAHQMRVLDQFEMT